MKIYAVFGLMSLFMCQGMAGAAIIFMADLSPNAVVPQTGGTSPAGISSARGTGVFRLNLTPGNPTLSYEITFSGISVLDDITGIHLHFGHEPVAGFIGATFLSAGDERSDHQAADGPNGPHLLNIFRLPREDDSDLFVNPENNSISGQWDNSDENFGPDGNRDPGDSVALKDGIGELLAEEVYIQVHTKEFPAPLTGELRGQLKIVPEPAPSLLLILGLSAAFARRQRAAQG